MSKPLSQLPHPPGRFPLVGDIRSVDRRTPTQHETRLAKDLGPIYQRLLLRDRLVVVAGAELAQQCTDEKLWGRVLIGPTAKLRDIAGAGLFTARSSDPLWSQARAILSPGFSQEAMRVYHSAMTSVAMDLVDRWSREPADVHRDMTAATLEVIGRAGFSQPLGVLGNDRSASEPVPATGAFLAALERTLDWASETSNDLPILGSARSLATKRQRESDIALARAYVDGIVQRRRKAEAQRPGSTSDLLDLMLTTRDPKTGESLPDNNIRDQVLTFLVAGHETTAALMEVALYYLAADPALAAQLREASLETSYDEVSKNRALRAFLNECLRLWPPVPGFFRVSRVTQDLGEYSVPAGRAVFVLALAAQRDREAWGEDADTFRAERFLEARVTARSGRFFAPWGAGPRSCIGRQFALHEAAVLLSTVLQHYDLELADGAGDLRMRERGTLRPEKFDISVRPRTRQMEKQ